MTVVWMAYAPDYDAGPYDSRVTAMIAVDRDLMGGRFDWNLRGSPRSKGPPIEDRRRMCKWAPQHPDRIDGAWELVFPARWASHGNTRIVPVEVLTKDTL